MGMRDEIQAELAEAFDDPDGLADAVKPLTGSRTEQGEYDPDNPSGEIVINYTGRGVFGSYLAREIDGTLIETTDVKLLALQNELLKVVESEVTEIVVEPKIGDLISGKRVLNVSADPADATWTLQLRV